MKTIAQIQAALHKDYGLVGRDFEVESLVHCVRTGKHVLLEGPVGVGKTFLVSAVAELDGSGNVSKARIALSGVADTPVRATEAEQSLVGKSLADGADEAGRLAEQSLSPGSDFHASSEYRKEVSRALVTRALKEMSEGAAR